MLWTTSPRLRKKRNKIRKKKSTWKKEKIAIEIKGKCKFDIFNVIKMSTESVANNTLHLRTLFDLSEYSTLVKRPKFISVFLSFAHKT